MLRQSQDPLEKILALSNASELAPLWNVPTHGAVFTQPVVSQGTVYSGSWDGYEYAVNATRGNVIWKTFLGLDNQSCGHQGVTSSPTVSGSSLYLGGGDGYFYALSAASGHVLWKVLVGNISAGYYNWASPLIYNGFAYVGIASLCDKPLVPGGLLKVSLTKHAVTATFHTTINGSVGASIWGSPMLNPTTSTIFVVTGNPGTNHSLAPYSESIVALDASTLAVKAHWQVPSRQASPDGDFGSTPTLVTPVGHPWLVVATNKNGYTYAWYQSNLTLAWSIHTSITTSIAPASWGGGRVYVAGANTTINGVYYLGAIRALNPLNGHILWQVGVPVSLRYSYGAPVFVNGLLVVPVGKTLEVLNASNGHLLWQFAAKGSITAPPSVSRGEVFAGSGDGNLYAFDLPLVVRPSQSVGGGPGPLNDTFDVSVSGGLPPYSYAWTFGDGASAASRHVLHAFASAGQFVVNVNVTDQSGRSASASLTTTVYGAPSIASLLASPSSGPIPLNVSFSSSVNQGTPSIRFAWNFGDGGTSNLSRPNHVFTQPGSFGVTLTVTDGSGRSASANTTVLAYAGPPSVSVGASPDTGVGSLNSTFSASVIGGNAPFLYSWNFGDGGASQDVSPSHQYTNPGTYLVNLTVTDARGQSATANTTVTVFGPPPSVTVVASATQGFAPLNSTFGENLTGGAAPFDYTWNFGDGNASQLPDPYHVFSAPGVFVVNLTVTDSSGQSGNGSILVRVFGPPPTVSISSTPAVGSSQLNATFSPSISGGNLPFTYDWDFGDGNTSTSPQPQHVFAAPGTYLVTLSVTDASGTVVQATTSVTVYGPPPLVSITAYPSGGPAPLNVTLNSSTTGGNPPFVFSWTFGDNNSSSVANPSHVFTQPGSYQVELNLTDASGASVVAVLYVNVTNVTASGHVPIRTPAPAPGLSPVGTIAARARPPLSR